MRHRPLAERYFGREDPIGQYLDLPDLAKPPASMDGTTFSIIGVVEDVHNQGPLDVPWPGVYLPTSLTVPGNTPRRIMVRTNGDAEAVVPALERAVRAVDFDVPVQAVRSRRICGEGYTRSLASASSFSLCSRASV